MSQLSINLAGSISSALGGNTSIVSIALGTTASQFANALDANSQTTVYNQTNFFTDYYINCYYRTRNNILQMPNATPQGGPPVASIVQWANPIVDAIVEFSATAPGNANSNWPAVPSPVMNDSNMVLMEQMVWPESPTSRADGASVQYRIHGKYVYALINPNLLVMRAGQMPWMNNNGNLVTTVPTTVFTQSIFNPSGSASFGSIKSTITGASGGGAQPAS